jgi:hypothetical protein
MGLSVGKPMGRHPFPVTSTQNPKMDPKIGLASLLPLLIALLPWQAAAFPKVVKYDQVFFKTWSRANREFHFFSKGMQGETYESDIC